MPVSDSSHDRARTPEAKEELRNRILDEAVALFVEEGYDGFSMRKLAARLGYSATTIYVYFENKDDLLFAVIGRGYERFRFYLQPGERGDPLERLKRVGQRYLDFAFENRALYRLMFIDRPAFLFDLSAEKVTARLAILDDVAQIMRRAPVLAGLDDAAVREITELFWALLHGLVSLALTVPLFEEKWARDKLRALEEHIERMLPRPS